MNSIISTFKKIDFNENSINQHLMFTSIFREYCSSNRITNEMFYFLAKVKNSVTEYIGTQTLQVTQEHLLIFMHRNAVFFDSK